MAPYIQSEQTPYQKRGTRWPLVVLVAVVVQAMLQILSREGQSARILY
jgi:hypothetical protein